MTIGSNPRPQGRYFSITGEDHRSVSHALEEAINVLTVLQYGALQEDGISTSLNDGLFSIFQGVKRTLSDIANEQATTVAGSNEDKERAA